MLGYLLANIACCALCQLDQYACHYYRSKFCLMRLSAWDPATIHVFKNGSVLGKTFAMRQLPFSHLFCFWHCASMLTAAGPIMKAGVLIINMGIVATGTDKAHIKNVSNKTCIQCDNMCVRQMTDKLLHLESH
jgi:hypothetical protein